MTYEVVEEILLEAEIRMEQSVEALDNDLRVIRTGRASPALVEHIPVTYYGMPTPLQKLAVIGVPQPRLITIKPHSPSDIGTISKAIMQSNLGINPSNDGTLIRLVVPELTGERRKELVRQVHERVEEARVAVRNIRRDARSSIDDAEKNKDISEDEKHRGFDELQDLVDEKIQELNEKGEAKEAEIMEI